MATAIALQQPPAPSAPAAARGFRLVRDLRGVVRLLCNLSGFGTVVTYAGSAHSPHREEPQRFAADLSAFARRHCA